MCNFVALSLCALFVFQVHSTDVRVETSVGNFIGIENSITIDDTTYKVAQFLGIPYAEPPVGNLRFRVPVPKAPHSGSMIVQQMSQRCLEMFPYAPLPQSEDCLYLNVVVPEKFDLEKLPVMVWIHGGGFTRGSANEYEVDGLAAYGNVIVVAMNYRLSVWGFLSTEDSNSPGNYGLWDQRLALQWVKDNIEAFGGDNSRITVFGESAGAASVIYQGLYPGNKGLFQRIIAQSGSPAATWTHNVTPKNTTEFLAKQAGCYNDNTALMVDCLRNLNASILYGLTNDPNNALQLMVSPSIDNVFVTCNPDDLLNPDKTSSEYTPSRETFASFDFMTGINSGEGAMAFNPLYGYLDPETFLPNITYFRDVLVRNFVIAGFQSRVSASNFNTVTSAIYDKYTDDNTIDDPYVIRLKTADMFSDALFLTPMKKALNTHTMLSTKSTYMYYLSVVPSVHILPTPTWFKRANHADDMLYIFVSERSPFQDEPEFLLAELMVSSWTNFAKTGDPNSPRDRGLSWGKYTVTNPVYVDLKRGTTSEDVKEGLFEDRADFWLKEMPPVVGYVSEPCKFILDTSGASSVLVTSRVMYACVLLLLVQLFNIL